MDVLPVQLVEGQPPAGIGISAGGPADPPGRGLQAQREQLDLLPECATQQLRREGALRAWCGLDDAHHPCPAPLRAVDISASRAGQSDRDETIDVR